MTAKEVHDEIMQNDDFVLYDAWRNNQYKGVGNRNVFVQARRKDYFIVIRDRRNRDVQNQQQAAEGCRVRCDREVWSDRRVDHVALQITLRKTDQYGARRLRFAQMADNRPDRPFYIADRDPAADLPRPEPRVRPSGGEPLDLRRFFATHLGRAEQLPIEANALEPVVQADEVSKAHAAVDFSRGPRDVVTHL